MPFGRGIRNVARLDRIDAKRAVEGKCGVQLSLVVDDSPRSLVVRNEFYTLLLRVRGNRGEVVVRIRPGERESVCILDPVAVPAGVPPFDKHAAEAVGRCK